MYINKTSCNLFINDTDLSEPEVLVTHFLFGHCLVGVHDRQELYAMLEELFVLKKCSLKFLDFRWMRPIQDSMHISLQF